MSALFDARVEHAVRNIWFDLRTEKREKSLAMLREAANTGDGDAFYFLGQCYMGKDYTDPAVGLPDDRTFAFECFNMSLGLESAVGMLGTMLIEGYEPPHGTFVHPPYRSLSEIWNAVSQRAESRPDRRHVSGRVFCKYLIAGAYYSCRTADFLGITPEDSEKYRRLQYEWAATAAGLYKECVIDGLGIALPKLTDILTSGRYGAPIQRKMADQYRRMGAAMGVIL